MARQTSLKVVLSDEVRSRLAAWRRATKTPTGLARRAWAVVLVADGQSLVAAGRQVGMDARNVRLWVVRFLRDGLPGLHDRPRSGRPPVFSPGGGAARGEDRLRIAG